jgi:hypothetical protein
MEADSGTRCNWRSHRKEQESQCLPPFLLLWPSDRWYQGQSAIHLNTGVKKWGTQGYTMQFEVCHIFLKTAPEVSFSFWHSLHLLSAQLLELVLGCSMLLSQLLISSSELSRAKDLVTQMKPDQRVASTSLDQSQCWRLTQSVYYVTSKYGTLSLNSTLPRWLLNQKQ